ncbi:MAG: glycosyltransferase family 9 protein [Proteobacteria bacterium]|nr:glycosyltransferase family 9 protein [Pseudomonadota bacterium]
MSRGLADWKRFRRVLCVRPDNIGDVLMTTPAIRALKQALPAREVTLLTSGSGAAVAQFVPWIDDIEVFDPPWYRHEHPNGREDLRNFAEKLSRRNFDAAIIFTVFSQNPLANAMLCYEAGIPRVAGYCRENPYELITDWLPDNEPLNGARHEVQRQLDLVAALGATSTEIGLSLNVPKERASDAREVLRAAGIDPDAPWLLMHPGASEARRRYPAEGFAMAAREIHSRLGIQVVITGSATEAARAESIAESAGPGICSAAGRLDMPAFIALVSLAPLVVSNNTGPVHIAAAVGTPVVVLYALTNPQHAPWGVPNRILPFDVPLENLSRNVLVRYAAERYFAEPRGSAAPEDIVNAVAELLQGAQDCPRGAELVSPGASPGAIRSSELKIASRT